jgi:hypothetical protein
LGRKDAMAHKKEILSFFSTSSGSGETGEHIDSISATR